MNQTPDRREILQFALGAGIAAAAPSVSSAPSAAATPNVAAARKLLLIAGTQSHPPGTHEYNAGVLLLQQCLAGVRGLETRIALSGWPKDKGAFDGVDAVFLYMDGGSAHYALQGDHLKQLDAVVERGGGIACCHYAVELPAGPDARHFQSWLGGTYETNYSCNPIWTPEFSPLPTHPVARGVKPIHLQDEWYMSIRFAEHGPPITPILAAAPSDAVRHGPYVSPRGPYDHVIKASGQIETLMWTMERPDGGRGFGFTGAHYHKNWANDDFRKVVLNALAWLAKCDIPPSGVESAVTPADMKRGLYNA